MLFGVTVLLYFIKIPSGSCNGGIQGFRRHLESIVFIIVFAPPANLPIGNSIVFAPLALLCFIMASETLNPPIRCTLQSISHNSSQNELQTSFRTSLRSSKVYNCNCI